MDTSHQHTYLSCTRYRRHVYNKDPHSHHAYCRKTSVSKYVRSSRLSVHPMGLAPPEDSSVVTHGLPAHPAAVLPGLISQAHAGSTWAAHKHIIQLCVLYFIHIPYKIILEHVFLFNIPLCSEALSLRHAPWVFLMSWWFCSFPLSSS